VTRLRHDAFRLEIQRATINNSPRIHRHSTAFSGDQPSLGGMYFAGREEKKPPKRKESGGFLVE